MEEDVAEMVVGGTKGEGELLVDGGNGRSKKGGRGRTDKAEASDCACLSHFLELL